MTLSILTRFLLQDIQLQGQVQGSMVYHAPVTIVVGNPRKIKLKRNSTAGEGMNIMPMEVSH